ncbi:beta strand repeat-containing protein, partial [Spiribacter roseus]|uniref:beta strand repeat-containing protein n=1 Tax=Spiribacter roseus TaxID=1855875 RepID=UPI0013301681
SGDTINYDVAASGDAWDASNLPELNLAGAAANYDYTVTGSGDLELKGEDALILTEDAQVINVAGLDGALDLDINRAMATSSDEARLTLGEGLTNINGGAGTGNLRIDIVEAGAYSGDWSNISSNDALVVDSSGVTDLTGINNGADFGDLTIVDLIGGDIAMSAAQLDSIADPFISRGANLSVTDLGSQTADLGIADSLIRGSLGTVTLGSATETLATDTNLGDFDLALDNGDTVTLTNSSLQADSRTISTTDTGENTTVAFNFSGESSHSVNASGYDSSISEYQFEKAGTGTSTFSNLSVNSGTTLDFSALDGGNFEIGLNDGGSNTMTIGADVGTGLIDFDIGDSTWDGNNLPTFEFGSTASSFAVTGSGTFDLTASGPLSFSAHGQSLDASAFTGNLTAEVTREGADTDSFDINLGQGVNDVTITGGADGNGTVSFVIPSDGMGATTITGFATEPDTETTFTASKNDLLDFSNLTGLDTGSIDDTALTGNLEGLDNDGDFFDLGDLKFTRSGSDVEITDTQTTDQALNGPITIVAAEDDLSAGNLDLDGTA